MQHQQPRGATAAWASATAASPRPPALNLVLLGDVMLGRYVDDQFELPGRAAAAAFGDVLRRVVAPARAQAPTIVAGNLECAVTDHPVPTPKAFNFKLSPRHAPAALGALSLDYASLANNHVLDYGLPGMMETHEVLGRLGVAHSGSGPQPDASAPAVVRAPGGGGPRVAFLSYADHYEDWAAGEGRPGINFVDPQSFSQERLRADVAAARAAGAELVVVFVHWGPNWRWRPDGDLARLAGGFAAAGADLVFGHSAHHLQGVQFLGSCPVVYGAGGFLDDYATDESYRNDLGAVWLARFWREGPGEGKGPGQGQGQGGGGGGGPGRALAAAAAAEAPAGEPGGGGARAAAGQLVLGSLEAHPTRIRHEWRRGGGPFGELGAGDPPYLSQVDLARGEDHAWVARRLRALSAEWGTKVEPLPGGQEAGLRLLGGALLLPAAAAAAAAPEAAGAKAGV